MGRSAARNEPSAFVTAERVRLVARLRIVTSVFCTTAPLGSVTVPLIEPNVCCPVASCGEAEMAIESSKTDRRKSGRDTPKRKRQEVTVDLQGESRPYNKTREQPSRILIPGYKN